MIKLGIDYIAQRALIFNKKSYILQMQDGSLVVKGNTLRGRSIEPFCVAFINECVDAIFSNNKEFVGMIYANYLSTVVNGQLTADDIAQRAMLNMEVQEYEHRLAGKQTNRAGAYEAAKRSTKELRRGDMIHYYISKPPLEEKLVRNKYVVRPAKLASADKARLKEEFDGDYDIDHYSARLEQAAKRFIILYDFESLFDIKLKAVDKRKLEKIISGDTQEDEG